MKMEVDMSLADLSDAGVPFCPVCGIAELALNQDDPRSSMNICVDCQKMTCSGCGTHNASMTPSRLHEWVCSICDKRRRLLLTSGVWYHGCNLEPQQLSLERQVIEATTDWATETDSLLVSNMNLSIMSSVSQASSRGSRGSRGSRDSSEHTNGDSSWGGSRCGGDSGLSLDLSSLSLASSHNSELARQVYEQSKVKGPGAMLPKSESDEFSDLTSDYDFDELASERSRLDGGSSTDEASKDTASVSSQTESIQQKYRPIFLNLSRPHYQASLDEDDVSGNGNKEGEEGRGVGTNRTEDGSAGRNQKTDTRSVSKYERTIKPQTVLPDGKTVCTTFMLSENHKKNRNMPSDGGKYPLEIDSQGLIPHQGLSDSQSENNASYFTTQNWQESSDSPPFDPHGSDLYPGSLPSEDTNNSMACPRMLLASGSSSCHGLLGHNSHGSSATSEDEVRAPCMTTIDDALVSDMRTGRVKPEAVSGPYVQQTTGTMTHSPSVMDLASFAANIADSTASLVDLASFAANIADSTASLTLMSVSPPSEMPPPTPYSPLDDLSSPDSEESTDSNFSSPVSPDPTDNNTSSAEGLQQSKIVQPSSKSVDLQSSKRPKMRPSSTDWSPVVDLSPIQDVSPSLEEAEREDMLAKQMEEFQRQMSRDHSASFDRDEGEDDGYEKLRIDNSFASSRYCNSTKQANPGMYPRIPPPPSTKQLKKQLSQDHPDSETDQFDTGCLYTCVGTLKRSGHFQDISRLDSECPLVHQRSQLSPADRIPYGIDILASPDDSPFCSCTTEAQTLSHSAPCISKIAALHVPGEQSCESLAEDHDWKRLKDLEALITDQIHIIAEDMDNIIKRDSVEDKLILPQKSMRKLPDSELDESSTSWMLSSEGLEKIFATSYERGETRVHSSADGKEISSGGTSAFSKVISSIEESAVSKVFSSIEESAVGKVSSSIEESAVSKVSSSCGESSVNNISSSCETSSTKCFIRQDFAETKKAKDMKQNPDPVLLQHIESEEESVSPHYKVMHSSPTPGIQHIQREYCDSTSISMESHLLQNVYTYPSPVTPPDSDSSPPKPHSPTLPGTYFASEHSKLPYGAHSYTIPGTCNTATSTKAARKHVQTSSTNIKQDDHAHTLDMTYTTPKPVAVVRPPISPRKSLRKLEENRITCGTSAVNEHVMNTPGDIQKQGKNAPLFGATSRTLASMKGGLTDDMPPTNMTHFTQMFIYPVVGEFPGQARSGSTPFTDLQQQPFSDSPLHERADDEHCASGVRVASVRAKIREFEEITRRPHPDQPNRAPRREPQREPDREPQRDLPREAQREPDREPQREPDREPQRESYIEPQREPDREPQRDLHREAQREPDREPQREPYIEPQREPDRKPQREPDRKPQRDLPREAQREPHREHHNLHREPQREPHREPRRESRREAQRGQYREAQREPHRQAQRELHREAPRVPHREPRADERVMKDKRTDSGSSTSSSGSSARTSTSVSSTDPALSQGRDGAKEGKKIRRKLPQIPVGEEPVLVPKLKTRRARPPAVMRSEGVDKDDSDLAVWGPSRLIEGAEVSTEHGAEFFIGPTNRMTVTRKRGEFLNERNIELARLADTRGHSLSTTMKRYLVDAGKSKSLDSGETSRARAETSELSRGRHHLHRTASLGHGPKNETDEIIDSLIGIYGIPCTEAMKSLKKRVQEELRRVTRDRKRKLEELEEIRALQIQIGALKLESDACARSRALFGRWSQAQHLMVDCQHESRKRGGSPSRSSSLTPRSSPQVAPRRQRHKRQSSDPMVAKFSPIKEDKDIETDFQIRLQDSDDSRLATYLADDSSPSGVSDSESTRSEPVRDCRYIKVKPLDYTSIFYNQNSVPDASGGRSHNSSCDQGSYDGVQPLCVSRSDQLLSSRTRTSVFYSDDEECKAREEKKVMLQFEIMKRKQQLAEVSRLKDELLQLARAKEGLAHSFHDIPGQYGASSVLPRPIPRGIIKPIDDLPVQLFTHATEMGQRSRDSSQERSRERSRERMLENGFRECEFDSMVMLEHRSRETSRHQPSHLQPLGQDSSDVFNYSSTEYLAHKSACRRSHTEPTEYDCQGWMSEDHSSHSLASCQTHSQPILNKRTDSSQSLSAARRESARKDPGISSSVTLPNIYYKMEEKHLRQTYREPIYVNVSDTDGSPASDVTPAMPLLDDVKAKSRTILRNIGSGSRPVSAEFSVGDVEDLMNAMYRVESDNSVDADEPIMKHMTEGGVTILKQTDRKRRPAPLGPRRYSFPVKRILVTRDAKDKSITGSGLGLKIVGGTPGPGSKQLGAYVTAIYSIIADQLHGELDVGDQVLEWNGNHLTGLSSEEVQDIIQKTNGEIEMVVKVQVPPLPHVGMSVPAESQVHPLPLVGMSVPAESRSSYDELDLSAHEEPLKEPTLQRPRGGHRPTTSRHGVDPRQLAAQLEGIQEPGSPADNSPSSSKDVATTPSVSSPCSTPRSEPTSTSSSGRHQQLTFSTSTAAATPDRSERDGEKVSCDQRSSRHTHRHSPVIEKSHTQKQTHQQQPPTLSQRQQHSLPVQQQHLQSKADMIPPGRTSPSTSKTDRRKHRESAALPAISVPAKPRPSVVVDQSHTSTCSSPAFNDRLRASPPLDYRLSVRSRSSKKGKDSFVFPAKSLPEVERGEDFGLGEIQLQISHDDFDNTLNIHVIQARNLRPQDLNGLSDPFVKLYLLPGRGPENKRRTKHIARTLNPEWHQTVMCHDVARLELQNKVLEVTVWDYDRFKANDFLGELVIELKEFAFLDNKPHWYPLKEHVNIQTFELPKSSVSPPKPSDIGRPKSGSPRHGKKLGVSSLSPRDPHGKDGEDGPRRRSLGALSGNGTDQMSAVRQVSSATNSPLPSRRPLSSRSPIKTRSKATLHR